jgi:hypothetical protein
MANSTDAPSITAAPDTLSDLPPTIHEAAEQFRNEPLLRMLAPVLLLPRGLAARFQSWRTELSVLDGRPLPAEDEAVRLSLRRLLAEEDPVAALFHYFASRHRWTPGDVGRLAPARAVALIGADVRRVLDAASQPAPAAAESTASEGAERPADQTTTVRLNETEREIIRLVRRKAMRGEDIADEVGISFGYARQVLARLVRNERLVNDERGYRATRRRPRTRS